MKKASQKCGAFRALRVAYSFLLQLVPHLRKSLMVDVLRRFCGGKFVFVSNLLECVRSELGTFHTVAIGTAPILTAPAEAAAVYTVWAAPPARKAPAP